MNFLNQILNKKKRKTIQPEEIEETFLAAPQENWQPNHVTFYGRNTRSILISGEINESLSAGVCSQIAELSSHSKDPITIYLNTHGGSIVDGLAIYDMMKIVESPTIVFVNGACYSAGLIILSAGNLRLATPNSSFFYHQPILSNVSISSTEESQYIDILYRTSQVKMDTILRKRSEMNKKKWKRHFRDSVAKHFDAEKALKYGMIDSIIEYAEKDIPLLH